MRKNVKCTQLNRRPVIYFYYGQSFTLICIRSSFCNLKATQLILIYQLIKKFLKYFRPENIFELV